MTPETLKKAQNLNNSIWHCENDLKSILEVIEDFDNFGSTIQFKRNRDDNSKSFGSKKFKFKDKLLPILNSIFIEASEELNSLRKELEEL